MRLVTLAAGVDPAAAATPGDPLTFEVVQTPAHGTLGVGTGRVAYTPATGYAGPDSFVLDDHGGAARLVQYRVSVSPRGTSAQRRPSPRR